MKKSSILFLLLFAVLGLRAEQVYLFADPSCSEQVIYTQSGNFGPSMSYATQQFRLNGESRLLLETGSQAGSTLNYVPEEALYCGDPRLDRKLVERINSKQDEAFLVTPTTQQGIFRVDRIEMAALFEVEGNVFSYTSALTGFRFDANTDVIGDDLSYNNPGARVYFEGRENGICDGVLLFRHLSPNSTYPVIDLHLSREAGLLERRLGSGDAFGSAENVIKALTVNGQPIEGYRQARCGQAPATYSDQRVYTPPVISGGVVTAPTASAAPANTSVDRRIQHTVSTGETLYGISRQYGVEVASIQSANDLKSSVVYPGQQLSIGTTTARLSAPAAAASPAAVATTVTAAPATTVPTLPYRPGNIADANPGAAQPVPYGSVATSAAAPRAVYGENVHVVQPGETVASLALKYGYTTARFREINQLGPNAVVKVGERVKTSDCNCPGVTNTTAVSTAAPAVYGSTSAAPQTYSAPAPAATNPTLSAPQPAAVERNAPARQPTGIPVVPGRTTSTINTSSTNPAAESSPLTISNAPGFGEVVTNAAQLPGTTLSELESRSVGTQPVGPTAAGAAPATTAAPDRLPYYATPAAPASYGNAPVTYGSAPAGPYGSGAPVGVVPQRPVSSPPTPTVTRAFHVVQEGETPYAIARRYNITTDKLRQLNNLSPADVIVPFQKLYIN